VSELQIAEQAHVTDTGLQRTANEDSYFAGAPVFAIADGMGGAQAGEVASSIARECLERAERGDSPPEAYLRSVAENANRRIHEVAAQDEERSGMGTTFTAALVDGEDVSVAHVGDSRAYLFREGDLRMLTSDHSLVEELRRQGKLTDEQAEDHPQRSIITRALGPESEVEVDTMTFRAKPGDVFLLCSDGLTTMVREDQIAATLGSSVSLQQAVDHLVEAANAAGGRDNITIVAFRVEEEGAPVEAPEEKTLVGPTAAEEGLSGERIRAAAERRRPAPAPARRRTWPKVLAGLLVFAALCAGAFFGARQVYFLGGDEGGRVALYRGLPYDLPFGIELYSEVSSSPVQVASLPEADQETVANHELRSEDDARSLIESLESQVEPEPEPRPRNGGGNQKDGQGDRKQAGGGS
jgi:protein phosphatase